MAEARHLVCIDEHTVALTRKELYALAAIISEAHGDICHEIGSCGDMDEATRLARHLEGMSDAANRVVAVAEGA